MTAEYYENINHFLVGLFNDILKIEGKALRAGEYREISMRDMHIIEAICAASGQEDNRTTAIARELDITTGTLTVAVNSLVKKGYVERRKDQRDRRVVRLYPTEKALRANEAHAKFHHDMVEGVMQVLKPEELAVLTHALDAVRHYFESKKYCKSRRNRILILHMIGFMDNRNSAAAY